MRNLTLILAFFAAGEVCSQTLSSVEHSYAGVTGSTVIVRDIPAIGKELVCYNDAQREQPAFLLHDHANGAYRMFQTFSLPTGTTPQPHTEMHLYVEDMSVRYLPGYPGLSYCYICGRYNSYIVSEPFDPGLVRYPQGQGGFVGRFLTSDIGNDNASSFDIQLILINEASSLTRMEMKDGLMAITTMFTTGEEGFTFFTDYGQGGDYWLVYPTDPMEKITDAAFTGTETLTDAVISADGNSIVAVSRIKDEFYKFALRIEKPGIAFDMANPVVPLVNFERRSVYDTYGLTHQQSQEPTMTRHRNDADIRLLAMPGSKEVTVAYECRDTTLSCKVQHNTALFKIEYPNFFVDYSTSMTGKQMVTGALDNHHTFSDMTYVPYDNTIAILHSRRSGDCEMNTVVQFPSWNSYGDIDAIMTARQYHRSLDVFKKTYVYLAGFDVTNDHLVHFFQNKGNMDNSCYLTRPHAWSEELLGNMPTPTSSIEVLGHLYGPPLFPYTGLATPNIIATTYSVSVDCTSY